MVDARRPAKRVTLKKAIKLALQCMENERRRLHSLGLSGMHPNIDARENEIIEAIRVIEILGEENVSAQHNKEVA